MMLRRSNLPEDMEMDILLRLPVKSLLRFRCVSKSWCACFQNPLFITNHYLKQTKTSNNNEVIPYFSLLDQTLSVKENIYLPLPKDFKFSFPRITITGPCNGLICWWIHHQITLWNPATREFKHLPTSHIQRPPIANFTLFNNIGFGFDSKTDDYKVICIFNNHCNNKIIQQVDLYTISTDSWREVEFPFDDCLVCNNSMFNTYINGVYHWEERRAECIISFDMADEVFSRLQLPFNTSRNDYFWNLGLLNGYLAVIHYPNYPHMGTEMNFDIWVMKEYGVKESWTKQLAIGPISTNYFPIGSWKNGGLFLLSVDEQLVLYNPNTQEIEKLQVHSPRLSAKVVNYVESLVPINGRREHEDEHFIRFSTQMGDA